MTADARRAAHEALDALLDAVAATARAEPPDVPAERLLSVAEAARWLGIGRSTLYGEIGRGALRSIRVGRRRLVPSSAVAQYATSPPGADA